MPNGLSKDALTLGIIFHVMGVFFHFIFEFQVIQARVGLLQLETPLVIQISHCYNKLESGICKAKLTTLALSFEPVDDSDMMVG